MKNPISNKQIICIFFICIAYFLAIGSAAVYEMTDYKDLKKVTKGFYEDKNGTIESLDGSFTITGGKSFTVSDNVNLWESFTNLKDILSKHNEALKSGAIPVKIKGYGFSEPIYGILAFNYALGSSYGPSVQSYYIKIPREKIQEAAQGNIAVVYEKQSFIKRYSSGSKNTGENAAWVLWLSNVPME